MELRSPSLWLMALASAQAQPQFPIWTWKFFAFKNLPSEYHFSLNSISLEFPKQRTRSIQYKKRWSEMSIGVSEKSPISRCWLFLKFSSLSIGRFLNFSSHNWTRRICQFEKNPAIIMKFSGTLKNENKEEFESTHMWKILFVS